MLFEKKIGPWEVLVYNPLGDGLELVVTLGTEQDCGGSILVMGSSKYSHLSKADLIACGITSIENLRLFAQAINDGCDVYESVIKNGGKT